MPDGRVLGASHVPGLQPPIVLLHGVTDSRLFLRPIAERLEYETLSLDLAGHGESTGASPFCVEQHVADVLETLSSYGISRCVLVGHSFGGLVAATLAAAVSESLSAVILLDPAVGVPSDLADARAETDSVDQFWSSEEAALCDLLKGIEPCGHVEAVRLYRDSLVRGSGGVALTRNAEAIRAAWQEMSESSVDLSAVNCGVVVVPAGRNSFLSPEVLAAWRRQLGGRLKVEAIECGHEIPLERPACAAASIRRAVEDANCIVG